MFGPHMGVGEPQQCSKALDRCVFQTAGEEWIMPIKQGAKGLLRAVTGVVGTGTINPPGKLRNARSGSNTMSSARYAVTYSDRP